MTNDPLHDFVHKAISELPTRRAPRSLIDRVNAAIAMRAALPWHARGFAAWPASARVLTVVAGVAAVAAFAWLGILGTEFFSANPMREIATERAPMVSALGSAFIAVLEGLKIAIEGVAQPYLLAALIVMGIGYAACIGAGAGVYRFLHSHRE
jgi:hypothetical protein